MRALRLICALSVFFTGGATMKPKMVNVQHQKGGDILDLRRDINGPMRNALRPNSPNKWIKYPDNKGGFFIPYVIVGPYNSEHQQMIKDAMKKLSQNTCLRFKPRTDEDDYVEITNEKNSGCMSNVGRSPTGVGHVYLEANDYTTCMEPRIVMHELMHTTGLWHEHSREDRDQYIKVHLENVEGDGYGGEDYSAQFEKVDSMDASTYGVPYDYKSIMHYAKDFFAKPGTITMETIDPAYQDIIGTVEEPSKNDYKKICSIYNCEYCMGKKMSALEDGSEEPKPQPHSVTTPTPFTQAPELCYDQDPFQCLILSKRGDLDCNPGSHFVHFCCSTCRKNGGQTTTVPTTTEKVFPSTTPSQGCVDENPFMCKKMKEFNMLDCSANMESCCQTCKANEGPAHANYEEDPNTTQTLHSTTRFCYDENPSRCKRLARNNELNCRSKIGRRKCCRTCETHQDYFVVFG
ncbi:hypothetical protein Y032_0053g2406 [Ancylostoma ceylanicum]|uniref:Metalloendopeptidase n=1 Tax=Ancylostoma ceylanicum TaxID=53326 RepID=A0A016U7T6_9BILA|nr:hypothetical protein Y032_0053g2406 [Ancylostoma ceylanicum]